jgi:hypothetical protein
LGDHGRGGPPRTSSSSPPYSSMMTSLNFKKMKS